MTSEKTQHKDAPEHDHQTVECQDTTVPSENIVARTALGINSTSVRSVWKTPRVEQVGSLVPNTFGSAGPPFP